MNTTFFLKIYQRRKQREIQLTGLTGRERNFPLSVEAKKLMVSSSKLWPLAAGPVMHGSSALPVLPTDYTSLTVCVESKCFLPLPTVVFLTLEMECLQ